MTIIMPTFANNLKEKETTTLDYIKDSSDSFNINLGNIHKEDN
jgi:hypothetical protein